MSDDKKLEQTMRMTKYYRNEYAPLIGRKIVDVRSMFPEEMEALLWSGEAGAMFTLDDGSLFIPMMDEEGNGAGQLFVQETTRPAKTSRQEMFQEPNKEAS